MLKKTINHAEVELTIVPVDPLLVKSGQATVGGADMAFVRTYHMGKDPEPFIPGSSLKGVIRSYAEMICRSLRDKPVPVCLPYVDPKKMERGEERQASCGLRFEKFKKDRDIGTIASTDVYRLSCPACRTFGSHGFMGRVATSDAYISESFRLSGKPVFEIRDGVAIDRLTGGPAGGAKYDLEVLTRAEFSTKIEIRNFERWQLGLIALVLRDMEMELVRIGFGKSRGLGRVRATVKRFVVSCYGKKIDKLTGLAGCTSKEECEAYGFAPENRNDAVPLPKPETIGLRHVYDLSKNWKQVLEPAVQDLVSYVAVVSWPGEIEKYTERRA